MKTDNGFQVGEKMNVTQPHLTSQNTSSSNSSHLDVHNMDTFQFENQLDMAENDIGLFEEVDAEREEDKIYDEQVLKKRTDEDQEKKIIGGMASHAVWDQILSDKSLEAQSSVKNYENGVKEHHLGVKKDIHNKAIGEKLDVRKAHLNTPIIQDGEGVEKNVNSFMELLADQNDESEYLLKNNEKNGLNGNKELLSATQQRKENTLLPGDMSKNNNQQKLDMSVVKGMENRSNGQSSQNSQQNNAFTSNKNLQINKIGSSKNNASVTNTSRFSMSELNQPSVTNKSLESENLVKASNTNSSEQIDIKEVENKVRFMISNRKDELIMKLAPEHLGKLEIRLKKENDKIVGKFKVDNQEAKRILESQISQLQQGLEDQGVHVEEFIILLNENGNSSQSFSLNQGSSQQQKLSDKGLGSTLRSTRENRIEESSDRARPFVDSGVSIFA